ncbi:hypothetical protein RFI_05614 [Reticulomyxa filosa]|uniref:Delta(24(24(1)))-sterol reductase n=1 Tax=Reticulomyxa filosa TaxID=46433 RepID=X6P042_RETFI|nr:hypothetical protein RFI_05614 [Reticulomyxa filosa]|eukprot:ETO31508.1 hypothetical protein RFI_05614 [Reticulomyxa filosa]
MYVLPINRKDVYIRVKKTTFFFFFNWGLKKLKRLTTSVIFGDLTSLLIYLYGIVSGQSVRMSGNHIYDFFMGSLLYPRMFGDRVDIKMISEVRWSWLSLFVITLSCALKSWQQYHTVTPNLLFLLLAHWLYSNACVKGEHYIPYFWDMYYEKYGWMLNFWNITGVPFLYCFQSLYVYRNHASIVALQQTDLTYYLAHLFVCLLLLCGGYYIWDCANGQKADFKNPQLRKFTKFPNLPHSTIDDAKYIETHDGRKLMIDGFWKYARKMNYTGDICMGLSWGLICHFQSFLPYFYVTFFVCMALHRFRRDDQKCAKNYGKKWEEYKKVVPYTLIPGLV